MKRAIVEYRGLYYDKAPAGVWLFHDNNDVEFLFYDGNDQENANEMLINAATEDALLDYLIERGDTIVRERVEVPVTDEDTIESLYKRFITDKEIPQLVEWEAKPMTIIEKVRDTFAKCEPGTIFTRSEIINMVKTKYGVNEGSIIPSDYCYNLVNKDKLANASLEKFKIFEWLSRGKYRYIGENYPYTGTVFSSRKKK